MLIQALNELGNLYMSDDDPESIKQAEVQWNDCVDTIYQRLYVLNSFRELFKDHPNIAADFGAIQCLIGGVVLAKLAKFCYSSNLQKQRECVIMASILF